MLFARLRRMHQVIVELCSRNYAYPDGCPCCGAEPDSELLIPLKVSNRLMADDTARRQLFPYCRTCVEHVAVWEAGSMTSTLLTLGGIVGGLIVGVVESGWYGLLVFFGAIAGAIFVTSMIQSQARSRCQHSCATAAKAVTYHGWSGSTNTFAFASATYTARFAEENSATLVSVDRRLRNILDAHRVARLQVPTPVTATRVVPPPRSLDEWLAHLEQQPSRSARRIALTRALRMIDDEEDRRQIVDLVCRAELAALFDEIDALPRSTKEQRLQQAIADIRADNVPDALRAAQLRELVQLARHLGS